MKKWIVACALVLVLLIAGFMFFIPGNITITRTQSIRANQQGILRTLMNDEKWQYWWPAAIDGNTKGISIGNRSLSFHGLNYQIKKNIVSGFEIDIQDTTSSVNSILTIVPIYADSCLIEWNCNLVAGINPINRIANYRKADRMVLDMDNILSSMRTFMVNKKNIYDMPVHEVKVTDTFLVSTNTIFTHEPSTKEIYMLFQTLENYATPLGAKRTNAPMLHVERIDSTHYKTTVAIPIDKIIPDKGDIVFKRMVPGNIVVAEVRGGHSAIRNGFAQLDHYLQDYQKSSVALQFESLITNRLIEADTSKWITRLYYPVY